MRVLIGLFIVVSSIILGYTGNGGHLYAIWQPFELLIILGTAVGAFIVANPPSLVWGMGKTLKHIFAGNKIGKPEYMELLCLLFMVFKVARAKGLLVLETHVEQPYTSPLFQKFPKIMANEVCLTFVCDYLRMFSMGSQNVYQMEDIMAEEIETYEHSEGEAVNALSVMADALPALGIVAAVLGVIHTMGAISQPPEVLGKFIGCALVGTFAGVLCSYGFVGPMAQSLRCIVNAKIRFLHTAKLGLVAYLHGNAPLIAIEQARKGIEELYRPTFVELEQQLQQLGDMPDA
jgi:chemotaxis protein MotA